MARYVKRPVRAGWVPEIDPQDHYRRAEASTYRVEVSDHEASFTGLLDHTGDEIWRAPNPMGFGRDEEWG